MNVSDVKKMIGPLFKVGMTPLLVGGHGKGKTEVVRQWCAENGYSLIEIRLGQMSDAADLLGLPSITKDNVTTFARPSFFPSKKKTVIFLDEINRAHKDLIQAVFQLILEKQVHEYKLPEDCHVIAACNPDTEEYTVVDFKDKAYMDRFCYIDFNPSVDEWLTYGRETKLNTDLLDFFAIHKDILDSSKDSFDYNSITPSRRSAKFVSDLQVIVKDEELLRNLLFGILGSTATTMFFQFKKEKYDSLVDADEVLNNFESQRKKVEAWVKSDNVEAMQKSSSLVLERLAAMKEQKIAATEIQQTNLEEFYKLVPVETLFQFIKAVYTEDLFLRKEEPITSQVSIPFFNSEALYKRLKPHYLKNTEG